jgi:hypothetical protein
LGAAELLTRFQFGAPQRPAMTGRKILAHAIILEGQHGPAFRL